MTVGWQGRAVGRLPPPRPRGAGLTPPPSRPPWLALNVAKSPWPDGGGFFFHPLPAERTARREREPLCGKVTRHSVDLGRVGGVVSRNSKPCHDGRWWGGVSISSPPCHPLPRPHCCGARPASNVNGMAIPRGGGAPSGGGGPESPARGGTSGAPRRGHPPRPPPPPPPPPLAVVRRRAAARREVCSVGARCPNRVVDLVWRDGTGGARAGRGGAHAGGGGPARGW